MSLSLDMEVKRMHFDLISDVHLDETLIGQTIPAFVERILPEEPSSILVFAGDFGYYNDQNISFLTELKKYYPYILYIYGNNDLKLPLFHNKEKFLNVKERVFAFEDSIKHVDGIYRLTEKPLTVNSIRFIGSDIFYDFDDLKHYFGASDQEILQEWECQNLHKKHVGWIDEPKTFAATEKRKLLEYIDDSDVIVTHGSPNYFVTNLEETMGFYRFDGEVFKDKIQGKVWCFGHRHRRFIGRIHGCMFYNASYFHHEKEKIIRISI